MKFHLAADARVPARLRARRRLGVPILVHFQEVPHFDGEGVFDGVQNVRGDAEKFPKTTFVSMRMRSGRTSTRITRTMPYPTGPVARRVTDRLLGDYGPVWRPLGEQRQQRDAARRRLHARVPEAPPGQADLRKRLPAPMAAARHRAGNNRRRAVCSKCVARDAGAAAAVGSRRLQEAVFDNSRRVYTSVGR